MPLTGTDFDRMIDIKSDNAYSGYFDSAKKNVIIAEAINKAIDFKVAGNDRIQIQDDLFGIFKSNVVYTPSSNTVSLVSGGAGISDYFHMMNVKCQFIVPLTGNYILQALSGSPIQITLYKESNLRTGENVVISGVTTNTNTNGSRYLYMLNPKRFRLYSDINLLTPVPSNGIYNGNSGVISRVVYNYAKDLKSSRKFSTLNAPTIDNPFYEIADSVVKVYPLTYVCSEVTVDYISLPTYIDVDDAVTDLYATYSPRFIDFIADETCRLMGMSTRDSELQAGEQSEMINQP